MKSPLNFNQKGISLLPAIRRVITLVIFVEIFQWTLIFEIWFQLNDITMFLCYQKGCGFIFQLRVVDLDALHGFYVILDCFDCFGVDFILILRRLFFFRRFFFDLLFFDLLASLRRPSMLTVGGAPEAASSCNGVMAFGLVRLRQGAIDHALVTQWWLMSSSSNLGQ